MQKSSVSGANYRSRPFVLSVENQVLLTLMYCREHRTQLHIAGTCGISKAAVCQTIQRIEAILVKVKTLHLPGKQVLSGRKQAFSAIVIDATEMSVERPQKSKPGTTRQKEAPYSKGQLAVAKRTGRLVCTAHDKGKTHDFRVLKKSRLPLHKSIRVKLDSGYQGMENLHVNSELPRKATKHRPLTKKDKAANKKRAKERVMAEQVIGRIKVFRILTGRYRNR